MAWGNNDRSGRGARLPANWYASNGPRAQVLRRDGVCRLGYSGCLGAPTQVDHIVAGDDHDLSNLQGVCRACHAAKSTAEGVAARQAKRARLKRPVEKHPGLL